MVDPAVFDLARILLSVKNLGEETGERGFRLAVAVVVAVRIGVHEHGYQVTPGR